MADDIDITGVPFEDNTPTQPLEPEVVPPEPEPLLHLGLVADGVLVQVWRSTPRAALDALGLDPAAIIEIGPDDACGMLWDGEALSLPPAPPPPVPAAVSMVQARSALIVAGLIGQVDGALAAIPDVTARALAETAWEYAGEVRRDSPLIAQLGPALGLSDAQIDDLFRQAAGM